MAAAVRTETVAERGGRVLNRHGRLLWRVAAVVVAVPMLVMGTYQAVSGLAHEEETVTTTFDGSGLARVEVDNGAGAVSVVGADGDRVTVRARVSHGLRSTGHRERMVGDRLVLDAGCPVIGSTFCRVDYLVEVPADVAVTIQGEGRISVSDVAGPVTATTDNGRVEVARVVGDVRLSSDNGRVTGTDLTARSAEARSDNGRVELSFVEPPTAVTADSDNGSVEVVLPDRADVEYRVVTSSDNGSESTQVDTDDDSPRTVTATSDNGDVTVRYPTAG